MCAINPKHQHHFTLSVYTSDGNISEENFKAFVCHKVLEMEVTLNEDTRLRWHVKEQMSEEEQNLEDARIIDQLAKMQP